MVNSAEEFYSAKAGKQAENYKDENMAQEFLEMREKFAEASGDKILDAGCGHGRDASFFQDQGLNVTGIDISQDLIEIAREKTDADFEVMDFRDLRFPDESFDSVWCSASIFFVPPEGMEKAVEEFYRVLRPEGRLFLSSKIGDGKFIKEKWGSKVEEWHISKMRGLEMVESAGFEVLDQKINESENGNDFVSYICSKPKESR